MQIQSIAAFVLTALIVRLLPARLGRGWLLSAASALAVFWLQPEIPSRYMSFWLPVLTILIVVVSWIFVTPPAERSWRDTWPTLLLLAGLTAAVSLSRLVGLSRYLFPSRPPQITIVLLALAAAALLLFAIYRFARPRPLLLTANIVLLLAVFVILKVPALALEASRALRALMGQTPALATAFDIRWLGYSYLAFRLIHTLEDRRKGRLPVVSLQEYFTYAVFFPTLTAGPIDRLERFIKDYRLPAGPGAFWPDFLPGGKRLLLGIFKKFVLADALALISLNAMHVEQTLAANNSPLWLWLMVYAYAFQIFFDFSGYTDIAIGLGKIMGFNVPENFHSPYLKSSLALFWNNWHITLTQWIRGYYFNPLTRWLRSPTRHLPATLVMFATQVLTMLVIGLWHGVSLNFALWGLWHGLGAFLENRWTDLTRPFFTRISNGSRPIQAALNGVSIFLVFNFVALGWLWFALPDAGLVTSAFARLFGGR